MPDFVLPAEEPAPLPTYGDAAKKLVLLLGRCATRFKALQLEEAVSLSVPGSPDVDLCWRPSRSAKGGGVFAYCDDGGKQWIPFPDANDPLNMRRMALLLRHVDALEAKAVALRDEVRVLMEDSAELAEAYLRSAP